MTETPQKPKRPRGRPAGQPTKVRLKPDPKASKERYYSRFGHLGVCCVFGVDEFTDSLIDYLWNKPDISFVVTDFDESVLANATRKYGQRSFSMYRWEPVNYQGFIEYCQGEVVVVSKEAYEMVKDIPNPSNVKLIVLEEL
jgi:hypothetical protein